MLQVSGLPPWQISILSDGTLFIAGIYHGNHVIT
jgi:hypothetical protein